MESHYAFSFWFLDCVMVDSFSLTSVLNILVPKPIEFGAHTLVLSLACLLRNFTGSSVVVIGVYATSVLFLQSCML